MSRIIAFVFAAVLLLIPSAAFAGNYQTCIQMEVDTVDSGFAIENGPDTDLTEDQWTSCDAGCNAIARGVRVKVAKDGWSQTFDSDPVTGCFDWSHTNSSGFFTLTVYGYATNVKGTFVRIHNGAYNLVNSYPASTYSTVLNNVTPTDGGSNTYYVGDYIPRWTTFASLAYGIYRFDAYNTNKAIHVGFDYRLDACTSGGAFTDAADYFSVGRAHLAIADPVAGGCLKTHSSRKFTVAHELGHMLLRLHAGINSLEAAFDYDHDVDPNASTCVSSSAYSMRSKEWNSVGFKEGFPHFVAARIWNDKATSGAFRWEGLTHDLERYGLGAGLWAGGRLENECCTSGCTTSWDSAGTNEDWLRFFWDFYTNSNCPGDGQPNGNDMFDLYKEVRTNGGLSKSNYYEQMAVAVQGIGLSTCLETTQFTANASLNGIDND